MANRSLTAKMQKAQRQAMGIYRPSTGLSQGDYRLVEAGKACFAQGKPKPAVYDPALIKRLAAQASKQDHRKRCGSDPRQRNNLTMSGIRSAGPAMKACVTWASYSPGESVLIARR